MEGRKKRFTLAAVTLMAALLASIILTSATPSMSAAAYPLLAGYQQSGAETMGGTATGKTVITGLHTVTSPVNIAGQSTLKGTITITAGGATDVKMGPGITMTGLNGQPFTTNIYANSFTQAEPLPPNSIAQTILVGSEQYPAVFQANGNITIGAVYNSTGHIVRGCLSQQASNIYMFINSSASGAGYIGDPLKNNRLVKSDTRTAIKVTSGTLTIYTQEYSKAFELFGIEIGSTADVTIRINSTHVVFDINAPGITVEHWNPSNVVSIASYGGVANFSRLAADQKLPTVEFRIFGFIRVYSLDLDDLIRTVKEQENNYYIDIINMEWGSGTVWEARSGSGNNPMILSDGSVVLLNRSSFTLRSNSTVMMSFSGGSSGVPVGLKVNGTGGSSPLVHIEALSLFAGSWGGASYMRVRGVNSVSMGNVEVVSDSQWIGGGASVVVDGYQEYPVSTVIETGGMSLTGSLLLERDYGEGGKCTFNVQGSISMPSGSSYISAEVVELSGDSVISGVVSISGRMRMLGSLTSTGDSDINGVSVLRNSVMTATGTVEIDGEQLISGSLSMSGGGMKVNSSGISVTGDTVVSGSLSVSGLLRITGDLTMSGDIKMSVAPFTSMSVKGSIETINGYVEVTDKGVGMGGESSVISGVVTISGRNMIEGSLTSTGDSDINGVSVLRNSVMTAVGTIKVEGFQLIEGSLSMSSSTTAINASGIFIEGNVGVDGILNVDGVLTVTGDVTMKGGVIEMYGSSKITGNVELSGKMNTNNLLTGTVLLTADSLVTGGTTVIRDGKVEVVNGVLKVTKDGTEIACSVKITGDIASSGTLVLSNVKMNGATLIMAPTITYGTTLVRGLMQILMSQSLLASMLTNPMLTLGQVVMAQSLILGSTTIEGTMTVTPNSVIITGTTDIMGALNAFTAPSMGLGSTIALSSAFTPTPAGLLSLPSVSIALTMPMVAMLALVGLVAARIIVPPVALAAGRSVRKVQKKYFAPETRAYMIYYRSRTRLSNTGKRIASGLRNTTRTAFIKASNGFYRVWSGPASKMASIELALQQQRKKLPMRFKAWHDRFMSRTRRGVQRPRRRPRISVRRLRIRR